MALTRLFHFTASSVVTLLCHLGFAVCKDSNGCIYAVDGTIWTESDRHFEKWPLQNTKDKRGISCYFDVSNIHSGRGRESYQKKKRQVFKESNRTDQIQRNCVRHDPRQRNHSQIGCEGPVNWPWTGVQALQLHFKLRHKKMFLSKGRIPVQ